MPQTRHCATLPCEKLHGKLMKIDAATTADIPQLCILLPILFAQDRQQQSRRGYGNDYQVLCYRR